MKIHVTVPMEPIVLMLDDRDEVATDDIKFIGSGTMTLEEIAQECDVPVERVIWRNEDGYYERPDGTERVVWL